MLTLSKYNVYIFDCDGVILDSNRMKIDAMRATLEKSFPGESLVDDCVAYFTNNFGKSRFHHVDVFLDDFLMLEGDQKSLFRDTMLSDFSSQCRRLYLEAPITPGCLEFISSLKGSKYVASGSAQEELRHTFQKRGLDKYFNGIFGSPTPKSSLIRSIINAETTPTAVMFGDSEADLIAATENSVDFVFYAPFSNVKQQMLDRCARDNLGVIHNFTNVEII